MKLSLIIPTYNEKENIQILILNLENEFKKNELDAEIIIVDDNSPDGTGEILEEIKLKYQNIKTIRRNGKLGLSSAVMEGFKIAKGDILGVMDADLSHPTNKIGELYQAIISGFDLVIGSRYIPGGKIEGWGLGRKILSRGGAFLAKLFTEVKDPMSGFFMLDKKIIENRLINPKGFKLLVEILVKANYQNIKEIPITFINRKSGKSKANIKEVLFYLQNLLTYLPHKKNLFWEFIKFALVGTFGTILNIGILYLFTEVFNVYYILSAIIAFLFAMTSNYILNKIWTFKEKINNTLTKKYFKYFFVSIFALIINIMFLYLFTEVFGIYYIFSQIIAIGLSLIINFIGNKTWTFR